MLKKLCLTILLSCACLVISWAKPPGIFYKTEFIEILKLKNNDTIERKLIYFFKDYFQNAPLKELPGNKLVCFNLLDQYSIDNKESYKSFIESICYSRANNQDAAENAIVKAVKLINNNNDHFLLYIFLSHLGVVQTDKGNGIGAIFSYFKAKKEVEKLNDYHLEASFNINISDLYYKNNIYNQSLFYLNKAEGFIKEHHLKEAHFLTIIYYNKAETFFRMGNLDSLKYYNIKLKGPENISSRLYTYRNRTDYYVQLLNHKYKDAIQLIRQMQVNKQYKYSLLDKQRLAEAYFADGQTDSAKKAIDALLKEPLEANSPEIKLQLYDKLAEIAEKNKDHSAAVDNFRLSLKEVAIYTAKLAQVGDVSSQVKIDEIESSYIERDENYRRQQLYLIFGLIVATLSIILIFIFYRSIRQKRHYENLLHKAEKHELAFLNSHDVRKHLCNILGIMDMIKASDEPGETYNEMEEHLYFSADQLDESIKNIQHKLDE